MDVRRDYKNTMDTNPTETTEQVDVPETGTSEESNDSSSSQDADYEALLEAEKQRKPDPEKAKEAFKKRQEKREQETDSEEVDEDRPLTKRELDAYLSRRQQEIVAEAHRERIEEIAGTLAKTPGEARYIVEIHKNRTFPEGMSIREQVEESYYIANGRKLAAKNLELARAAQSKETASKDTSTGIQESTTSEPKIAPDVKQALKNAGFTYDQSLKTYVKPLPNGKKLYRDPRTGRSGML